MNELHLFAGIGGGILGGILNGHTCVCAVENNRHCQKELLQRQRDGILPRFPIWDDITTFDGTEWRGNVDVVCGGFPCQDISAAGRGGGITGSRSGLWAEMARIVGEVQSAYVFVENSPMLTSRGLGVVLGDLAALGYDARWGVLGAHHAGAPHKRDRIWILANSTMRRQQSSVRATWGKRSDNTNTNRECEKGQPERERFWFEVSNGSKIEWWNTDPAELPDAENERILRRKRSEKHDRQQSEPEQRGETQHECGQWWPAESGVGRVADGVPDRVERLKALGNAQVPAVAALAWDVLINEMEDE